LVDLFEYMMMHGLTNPEKKNILCTITFFRKSCGLWGTVGKKR